MGLGAFSSILAILSTDRVAPAAMLQMQRLGTFFPINGPKAARVPGLLQRCNSIRLDRLSLAIGWRKGDSASLMSETAGGQAVSLLCACILSIFNDEDSSTILSYLCMRLLPPGTACASMSQLYDVATILSSKLDALGFGTFLAEQTIRVCKVYEQLDMRVPNGLLESFSLDSAVDILYSISRAVREPDVLVRISGTSGMGYIIAFIMTLFPEDCLIIVEGVIINSGVRQVIVIELNATANQECPTQISIEKILERKENISLPIETNSNKMLWGKFQWPGYLADQLHLHFTNSGLPGCPQDFLVAICDLLFSLPCWTEDNYLTANGDRLPAGGLIALLGVAPWHRIIQVWGEILGASPTLPRKNLKVAWSDFVRVSGRATSTVPCSCHTCTPEAVLYDGWITNAQRECPIFTLWMAIDRILAQAVGAVFVNPGENVSLDHSKSFALLSVTLIIRRALESGPRMWFRTPNIFKLSSSCLAAVQASCVSYPTELATLQKCDDYRISFELVDGMLVFNGRYFTRLESNASSERVRAKKSLIYKAKEIIPSSIGEHSSLILSIREKLRTLELGALILGPGRSVRIDLQSILQASIGLSRTEPCEHLVGCTLRPEYMSKVLLTSVFEPRPIGKKIGIAQVKGNAEAQLLCCEKGVRCVLQSECCLTCAVERAGNEQVIIIAS
jgi:hypothetical protein